MDTKIDNNIILDSIKIGVVIFNENYQVEYYNQGILNILKIKAKALQKLNAFDFIHPDYRQKLMELSIQKKQGLKVPDEHTLKAVANDGSWLWVDVKLSDIEYNGKSNCRLASITDVTNHVKARNSLEDSNNLSLNIIESSTLPKIVLYSHKNISFFNSKAKEFFKDYLDFNLENKTDISGLFRRSEWKLISSLINLSTKKGIASKEDILIRSHDGLDRYFSIKVVCLSRSNFNHNYVISFEDTSEARVQEHNLEKLKTIHQSLLETMNILSSFSFDQNYRYTDFNSLHIEFMKKTYNKEIEIGQSVLEYLPSKKEQERTKKYFDRALSGEEFNLEEEVGRDGEKTQYWKTKYTPIYLGGKIIGARVIVNDISKYIEKFDKYKTKIDSLKVINKNKDRFLSIIAHDLKAPMTGFIGLTKILESEIDDNNSELQSIATSISENAQSMFELLENLLEWTNSNTGKKLITPDNINLNLITQSIFALFKNNSQFKNIELKNSIPNDLYAFADANSITTVIRNLVSNSLKFTKEGSIEVYSESKNGKVFIFIKDTGQGMPEKILERLIGGTSIFTTDGTNSEKGSGIGLQLCREFVEKNGGKLLAESEEGKGTTFYFDLPASN